MASPLRLTIAPEGLPDAAAAAIADAAWTVVRATFEVAEVTMSRFMEDSELTRLNRRSPASVRISRPMERALVAADRAHRRTGGRFDPRVLDALERIGYTGVAQGDVAGHSLSVAAEPLPMPRSARPRLGSTRRGDNEAHGRVLEPHGRDGVVSLATPVDLGGIGKGLALRWAANALDASVAGAEEPAIGYLVDAGGDIVASGSPSGGEPWLVAIEDPSGGPAPVAVVAIAGRGAIATSSIRRLRWERGGRTVHHLIDPRTGEPGGEGLLAVTVAAPDPAWAEVWSKALFVEGVRGIGSLARSRGLAAWWVTDEGRLEMTPAARICTAWTASGT